MDKLIRLVRDFTAVRGSSVGGGFAEMSERDLGDLENIMTHLLSMKYEENEYGEYPIDVMLIDRTKHEAVNYEPVPYSFKDKDGHNLALLLNLRLNASRLDHLVNDLCLRRCQSDA